ncbi:hypothetical protein JYG23_03230 [Sedimentibacter sp. zth1]|uniref:hypothetical protein n=1 Tax=Sedimentibacter sp. zth1 TaxID=2816908 RepID=UPI001A92EF6D|nr:hypothetical protein [Sedimentibacter sp. zth1]QSX06486.1 hypothetical protein JYG23_03230 [Sedimentibacter sp. zth1]
MKLKASLKYYASEFFHSASIYYIIIFMITILTIILSKTTNIFRNTQIKGLELCSIIFIFVTGLNSFKSEFKFFTQNGVSRKSTVTSFMLSASCVAVIAIIDIIISVILENVLANYESMFNQIFVNRYSSYSFLYFLENFVYLTTFYMLIFMGGHFISSLYYKMNTLMKIIVSILLFIGANIVTSLNYAVLGFDLSYYIKCIFGYYGNTFNPILTSIISMIHFMVYGFLTFICVKNVSVRE